MSLRRVSLILILLLMPACGLNLDGGTGGASGGSGGAGGAGGTGGATGSGGSGDLCTDTCPYNHDNFCDDGGPLSFTGNCQYGTDCTDCGVRMPL